MVAPDGTVPPQIAAMLESGERLAWWDRPKQGFCLRPRDSTRIPFSLVWGGVATFMFLKALADTANPVIITIAGLFFLAGVYLVFGRFVHDIWRRARLVYAVTDRRVLIVSPGGAWSMDIKGLARMDIRRSGGDYGSLSFEDSRGRFRRSNFGAWSGQPPVPTFEFIRDCDRVAQAIRDLGKTPGEGG